MTLKIINWGTLILTDQGKEENPQTPSQGEVQQVPCLQ